MDERQEHSLTFSARVDVVALAKIARHFIKEGHRIRTMSQLINWSVEYLESILMQNGYSTEMDFVQASNLLISLGLMNPGGRNSKKIAASTRIAMARREGRNPESENPLEFRSLHNNHSVEPMPLADPTELDWQKAMASKRIDEIAKEVAERDKKIQAMKNQGSVVPIDEEEGRVYKPTNSGRRILEHHSSSNEAEIIERDKQLNNDLDELIRQQMEGRE